MYACTEEVLEMLWRATSRRSQKTDGDDDDDEEDASYARSPQRVNDVPDMPGGRRRQSMRSKIYIPQTAVFKDGVLKAWYFMQNGVIKKKMRKSLERQALRNEFIKEARPGRPVALLICTQQGADAMYTTQTQVIDEAQFLTVVKNAFAQRMTAMLQEYVAGAESMSSMAWVKNPPHDPRTMGLGCLQVMWSPTRMDIVLRGEEDLAAIMHHCVQRIDKDGRLEHGRLSAVVHDMGNRRHGSKEEEPPIRAVGKRFKRYPSEYERPGARSVSPSLIQRTSPRLSHPWDDRDAAERPASRGRRASMVREEERESAFSRVASSAQSDTSQLPRSMDALEQYHADRRDPAKVVKKAKPVIQFPILTSDGYSQQCSVIALDERTAVKNACSAVAQLLASSRTNGQEVPELKRFLAYFKRSQRGRVYLLWCAAAILLPSESISVRTVAPHSEEYDSIKQLLQNLVLNPGWYAKFCALEEDANHIKAFDLRASTMDLPEWMHFLRVIKMLPGKLSKQEATSIFKRANRVTGVSDDDRNELTFSEWKNGLSQVAQILGIDWEPIASAARFGELLMNPRLFKRFAQLPPCDRVLSETHMHFHQFYKLLQTYSVCPQLVSKDVAETAFRKTLREFNSHRTQANVGSPLSQQSHGPAHGASMPRRMSTERLDASAPADYLITQDGYRFALSYISEQCDINICYPEVYIECPHSEALLGGNVPPEIHVDDPQNRFFSPQRRVKNKAWNQTVVNQESSGSDLGQFLGADEDVGASAAAERGFGGPVHPYPDTGGRAPVIRHERTLGAVPKAAATGKGGATKQRPAAIRTQGPQKKLLQNDRPDQATQKRRLLQLRQGRAPSPGRDAVGTGVTATEDS